MICCIIPVLDISLQEPRFSFSSFLHLLFIQFPFLCRWRDLPCRATMQVTYTAERSKQNLWQTASQYQPPCLAMTWTESGLSTRNIICCIIPLLDVSLQECPLLFFFFFLFPSSLSSFTLSVVSPAMRSHCASHCADLHC